MFPYTKPSKFSGNATKTHIYVPVPEGSACGPTGPGNALSLNGLGSDEHGPGSAAGRAHELSHRSQAFGERAVLAFGRERVL